MCKFYICLSILFLLFFFAVSHINGQRQSPLQNCRIRSFQKSVSPIPDLRSGNYEVCRRYSQNILFNLIIFAYELLSSSFDVSHAIYSFNSGICISKQNFLFNLIMEILTMRQKVLVQKIMDCKHQVYVILFLIKGSSCKTIKNYITIRNYLLFFIYLHCTTPFKAPKYLISCCKLVQISIVYHHQ